MKVEIWVAVIAAIAPTLLSILAWYNSIQAHRVVRENKKTIEQLIINGKKLKEFMDKDK